MMMSKRIIMNKHYDDKYDDEESDNDDKEADHDVAGSTCTQALCYLLISSPCMIHTSRGL